MKVKRSELSNFKMVAGNEKKYSRIILDGVCKEWVGFGWIPVGKATEEDYKRYPEVED